MLSKQKIVSLIDLTQLGDNDSNDDIIKLCSKAKTSLGTVAAICVYKKFIPLVKTQLGTDFKVATVINFPQGIDPIKKVLDETKDALILGADEIDLVIDYKEYLSKNFSDKSCKMITEVKKLCINKTLKVIIESGELKSSDLIRKVTFDAITHGADFIKTSTGKTQQGATHKAAKIILKMINQSNKNIGFKASGGIKDYSQAVEYINLAVSIVSSNFVRSDTFRFGVSGLLDNLLLLKENKEVRNDY